MDLLALKVKYTKISEMLCLKTSNMTLNRMQLIYLKNEGLTAQNIADLLDVSVYKVQHYFKGSQPRADIIFKLETMLLNREYL